MFAVDTSDQVRQKLPAMTKSNTKIGFLSALVLSLALTGFGCDSDKKDVVVLDAAVDHSPSDAQQIASDSSTKLDVVVSLEVGSAETSGDDARLTDDGAVVTKDAPAPSADVAVDANRTASDATVD
jgi:hypothetical protein